MPKSDKPKKPYVPRNPHALDAKMRKAGPHQTDAARSAGARAKRKEREGLEEGPAVDEFILTVDKKLVDIIGCIDAEMLEREDEGTTHLTELRSDLNEALQEYRACWRGGIFDE